MGFTCWLLRSWDKQVLCVSRDWLVGGALRAPGAAVIGEWRPVKTFYEGCFSHSVHLFFSMSFTEGVFERGGAWVSSSQSSPVEMQACTFHHRVIVGWGQSTLGSQTQSSNRTQGSPCTSLEKHSECTVWLNQSIIISPNTSLVSFFRILYNPLSFLYYNMHLESYLETVKHTVCIWSCLNKFMFRW